MLAGEHPDRPAVKIVDADLNSRQWTYAELSRRSDQVANWLTSLGLRRGDHMIVMLNNTIEIWEILLGLLKVGGVAIPTSTLVTEADLAYRVERGEASFIIAPDSLEARFALIPGRLVRIGVGGDAPAGWVAFADSHAAPLDFTPTGPTPADDTSLLYFTSGTTARPKLVRHTQVSYPVGHLSTMWWLGVREGDVHLNISSPGWGKHAWSNFFSPFLAGATVFIFNYERFDAATLMRIMEAHDVTSFCAPPTVWRMLIQADLTQLHRPPRELVGAGEPLNPEVIAQVRAAWGNTIRDGFGQTEMTCSIGNSPGQAVQDGSMGRPMPGYAVTLLDGDQRAALGPEGEICLDLSVPNIALMGGYYRIRNSPPRPAGTATTTPATSPPGTATATSPTSVAPTTCSRPRDYKISPFELESVLLEHPYVAEAAVVPSPDPLRLAVPKAYVCLAAGVEDGPDAARAVLSAMPASTCPATSGCGSSSSSAELPKTISGKIRRVELRAREAARVSGPAEDQPRQYLDRDFR